MSVVHVLTVYVVYVFFVIGYFFCIYIYENSVKCYIFMRPTYIQRHGVTKMHHQIAVPDSADW